MDATLRNALDLHRAGRYADAARRYHGLLAREPENADALHLFGVMHHECGHSVRAAELIGRAVALRPQAAAFHANLADIHRKLGQHEQAIDCCRTALRLQPGYPEAANNLGLALQALGRHEETLEAFHAALTTRPAFALARNNLGVALRDLGRVDEAFEAFRLAVEADPDLAMARANLGQALLDRGEVDQALPHCEEAVRLQPDLAAAHNALGNAYSALDRRTEALAEYSEALRISPDLAGPRVHANIGLALQREGRLSQALPHLRRAVELEPDDAELWLHLAAAHADADDSAAAIPCCRRAVELRPESPHGHTELGRALQDEGQTAEALTCFRRALELDPDDFDAMLKLGGLHEELGEMDAAEARYRQARAIRPAAPVPLACLATMLRGRLPEEDRTAIRARLDDAQLDDGPRATLLFGLAHDHDARGEYAEAAACLEPANALASCGRQQRGRAYDPVEHSRFVDRLIEGFSPELFARLADVRTGASVGDDTRQPVFVFGMPRSGTTLVEQVLASHSRIHGAGELRLVRQTFEAIPATLGREDLILPCLAALDGPAVKTLARLHLDGLRAIVDRDRPGFEADRIVDKMPDNYLYLGLIALLFPRATLISVRRDPRDIALSCWMTNFRSIRWADDPDHLAGRIREYRRIMAHWDAVLPKPVHEVVYERLVDDFEAEAQRLVAACGLDWEPSCAEFHRTVRPVRTASVTQVRQPLYRKSLARWRNYERDLASLFTRLPGE
jgi:tetratricopeptide (TPR) repeat protein